MARNIKSGLIQMSLPMTEGEGTIKEIMDAMVQKHIPFIEDAGKQGVQILCLQEIFNTPYFCPGQDNAWYASAEAVPGPTTDLMQEYAKKYNMVIIVPIYEREQAGVFYNTAAVIDADGKYSVSMALPSLAAGHWDVELCDAQFTCAFTEIFVTGSDDLFTATADLYYLEAAFPGVKTNSTKISVNALSANRRRRQDLPTPESPISTSLNRWS